MYIVMHCGGMPFNGTTIQEQSLGGSESAAYYVAREMAAQGHRVTLFTNSEDEGEWDGVRYIHAGKVTEQWPLGDRFHFYAENTPHDVLIIQRHPQAFRFNWQAKIKLWWLHDLAIVRLRDTVQAQLWNIDGILTVSEFHRNQVCETWGINPEIVHAFQNGVDLGLFDGEIGYTLPDGDTTRLLYSSRPERGLEHLVAPNGIMERLEDIDPKYHLYVCNYDNTTPQMADYYSYLYERCEQLPNVTVLGHLTKRELADVMRQCDAMVYPTPGPQQPDFEEVSCITAMECMAAGLPFISTTAGALPETCSGSGSILLSLTDEGMPDLDAFVEAVQHITQEQRDRQKAAAKAYGWNVAGEMLIGIIYKHFYKNRSDGAKMRHMIRMSDIYAANEYTCSKSWVEDAIENACEDELTNLYRFAWQDKWAEHYEAYYEYEKQRGVDYGPENLDGNTRFEHVSSLVSRLPAGSRVLDYGCAHGHYTVNLAKRFPKLQFVGIDITESNIEKARQWADDEGLGNVEFIHGCTEQGKIAALNDDDRFQAVIAAEVVEHVGEPAKLVDTLCEYLAEDGLMIVTTPYGPWEAQGYEEHWPWRAHVHHFERADLADMFGNHPDFNIATAPSGRSKWGDALGSYITTFSRPDYASGMPDYSRKFNLIAPRQTVSLCMIVKDAEETLLRALRSAQGVVDEIIIGLDETTQDGTRAVIDAFIASRPGLWPVVTVFDMPSPLDIGFDEARNQTIDKAAGDWILWMDADEVLTHPDNLFKYLQNNAFDGYAIRQHHFAVQPLGVMKTDMPVRLFRNHKGIRFFGVVHEHPEKALNQGVGHVMLLPDVEIAHHGYTTEAVRRRRFDRNIDLLVADREKWPDRILGKFLWIRDLAQMCQYELEINGGQITPEMKRRAQAGIEMWEELLASGQTRMLVDGLQFYSTLAQILGNSFEFGFKLDASKANGGIHLEQAQPITAHFVKREHVDKLFEALTTEKVKDYESRYF